mgnify:CR=1 FL=1
MAEVDFHTGGAVGEGAGVFRGRGGLCGVAWLPDAITINRFVILRISRCCGCGLLESLGLTAQQHTGNRGGDQGATSTPKRASAESSAFLYASEAMRKDTVKPMPQATAAGIMSRTRSPWPS